MMKVLVTGGREFRNRAFVNNILDAVHAHGSMTQLIEGGATGADSLAGKWADDNGVTRVVFKANWQRYGLSAGTVRNCKMFRESQPDLVVAFEGARGTRHMIRVAELGKCPVLLSWNRSEVEQFLELSQA